MDSIAGISRQMSDARCVADDSFVFQRESLAY